MEPELLDQGRRPVPARLDDPAWVDDIVNQAVAKVETAARQEAVATPAPPRRVVRKVTRPRSEGPDQEPEEAVELPPTVAPGDEWPAGEQDGTIGTSAGARSFVARFEWALVVAGSLLVAIAIKTFLIQAFYIPSGSMLPTLAPDDRVLVNKVSYDLHDVNRGDLIVFSRPEEVGGEIDDLIKRVIGLPGDTVEVTHSVVYVNGLALDEPYLEKEVTFSDSGPVAVPAGTVFVMGDNRAGSRDSRVFGPVPVEDIVGRAFFRIWPPSRAGFL